MRGDASSKFEPGQVDQRDDRLFEAHLLARHGVAFGNHTRDRRQQLPVAQTHPCGVQLRLDGPGLGARRIERRTRLLEGDRRDELLVSQALVAGLSALGLR